jgi:small subunit ribosomal protein S12e
MSDDGEVAVSENAIQDALKVVLKKAMIHDGLVRGLRECAKALDRKEAHLCIMASNCDDKAYKKLITALCKTYDVSLLEVFVVHYILI